MEYKVDRMKELYKYFGEKKEEDQEMYSIANVFYEMGTKEESNETTMFELQD
ncbi:hypothetical protein NE686_00410 [Tissierella carlieri]|uniref:Uncharacterized protein n=1 Tax=Tissierella carlieri TaxID=689904 RepID=A0ABT1S4Z6_9FIRM|nr:hypothetical protein [Tissierella carlieri]MCQ4921530.1 hypothetical protein [Tissierella carlieri]